jgi:hypothetical protein
MQYEDSETDEAIQPPSIKPAQGRPPIRPIAQWRPPGQRPVNSGVVGSGVDLRLRTLSPVAKHLTEKTNRAIAVRSERERARAQERWEALRRVPIGPSLPRGIRHQDMRAVPHVESSYDPFRKPLERARYIEVELELLARDLESEPEHLSAEQKRAGRIAMLDRMMGPAFAQAERPVVSWFSQDSLQRGQGRAVAEPDHGLSSFMEGVTPEETHDLEFAQWLVELSRAKYFVAVEPRFRGGTPEPNLERWEWAVNWLLEDAPDENDLLWLQTMIERHQEWLTYLSVVCPEESGTEREAEAAYGVPRAKVGRLRRGLREGRRPPFSWNTIEGTGLLLDLRIGREELRPMEEVCQEAADGRPMWLPEVWLPLSVRLSS